MKPKDNHTAIKDHNYHSSSESDTQMENASTLNSQANAKILKGDVEKVLDLVKRDLEGGPKCLVKYKGNATPEWVPAADIRKSCPLLLIEYYETRIVLRKKKCEMAFDCTVPASRKLVVVTSK